MDNKTLKIRPGFSFIKKNRRSRYVWNSYGSKYYYVILNTTNALQCDTRNSALNFTLEQIIDNKARFRLTPSRRSWSLLELENNLFSNLILQVVNNFPTLPSAKLQSLLSRYIS